MITAFPSHISLANVLSSGSSPITAVGPRQAQVRSEPMQSTTPAEQLRMASALPNGAPTGAPRAGNLRVATSFDPAPVVTVGVDHARRMQAARVAAGG